MRRRRQLAPLVSATLSVALTGCLRDTVVFSTSTRLGIDISTTEQQPGVKVGYQRLEGVTMPLRVPSDAGENAGTLLPDAYPVLAGFMQSSSGFLPRVGEPMGTRIKQVFATGAAAKEEDAAKAVIAGLDPAAARAAFQPSRVGTELGKALLAALAALPAGSRAQRNGIAVIQAELDKSVSSYETARFAVQDAVQDQGREEALARALERVRSLGANAGDGR